MQIGVARMPLAVQGFMICQTKMVLGHQKGMLNLLSISISSHSAHYFFLRQSSEAPSDFSASRSALRNCTCFQETDCDKKGLSGEGFGLSPPNHNGFCSDMDHLKALFKRILKLVFDS